MWMAGGGIKGGVSVGETDELGSMAVVDRFARRLHTTILHLLGLDPNDLTFSWRPGQKFGRRGGRSDRSGNRLATLFFYSLDTHCLRGRPEIFHGAMNGLGSLLDTPVDDWRKWMGCLLIVSSRSAIGFLKRNTRLGRNDESAGIPSGGNDRGLGYGSYG